MVARINPEETWQLDGNKLLNSLSIAMVLCLVPYGALQRYSYLSLSLFAFVGFALVNHLFPKRYRKLTHVVKACYTHLLIASLSSASLSSAWLPLAVAVSLLDLLPMVVTHRLLAKGSEATGAAVRWGAIGYGFYSLDFPIWLLVSFALCTAIYYRERKARIDAGRRYQYGGLHSLEHLAVWIYLYAINAERLSPRQVWGLGLGGLAIAAAALVVLGVFINRRSLHELHGGLPSWFDERLRDLIEQKTRDNARSMRWQHYITKPFVPKLTNRVVRWGDIERMLDGIAIDESFDAVVGIVSGGAFIARYLAHRLDVGEVHYVRSRLWSQLSLTANSIATLRYYLGKGNRPYTHFLDSNVDLTGLKVLLVDDSVCTGATMASVAQLCTDRGASEVKTLVLYCNHAHPTDYSFCVSMTPFIWPWGWEAD